MSDIEEKKPAGQSKKVAIITAAIPAIVASDNLKAQVCVCVVAVVGIVAQAVLDWFKR